VRLLVSVGAGLTMLLAAVATHYILGWSWGLSFLLGAILTVTGPTVIAPLLRHVQPARSVASVLKWEGIVIDPIGAMLALLVLEIVASSHGASHSASVGDLAMVIVKMVGVGTGAGLAGAALIYILMRRYWIPDFLQNPVTLATVVAVFAGADALQHEAGLFGVTIMGIALANQSSVKTAHILEFKENLRVLLISVLFVVLAARVTRDQLSEIPWLSASLLLAVLVLVIRPLTVFLCSARSSLTFNQRAFIAGIAPRGIIAAAVASIFATRLLEAGVAGAEFLVPVMFFLIVGTVAIYGLGALPLSRILNVSSPDASGCIVVGAHPFAREFAAAIIKCGFRAVVVDTNRQNITTARLDGIETHYGSVVSAEIDEELDLSGLGKLIALTPNSEINSLACLHFKHHFGTENTYHLATHDDPEKRDKTVAPTLKGRLLFTTPKTFSDIETLHGSGATVRVTSLTESFTFDSFQSQHGGTAVPLALVTSGNQLRIFAQDAGINPAPGDQLVSLSTPDPGPAQ
ncbi:MAG: cation:proton antiporter, partial [Verrucomicrobiales bacterium]|nr:cation:proton antiporter [Verrucomicrobiales bacterium]